MSRSLLVNLLRSPSFLKVPSGLSRHAYHDCQGPDGDPHDDGLVVLQPVLGLLQAPGVEVEPGGRGHARPDHVQAQVQLLAAHRGDLGGAGQVGKERGGVEMYDFIQ